MENRSGIEEGIVALLATGKDNFPLLILLNDTVGCLFSKTVD